MHWRNMILAVIATAMAVSVIPPALAQGKRGAVTGAPRANVPARPNIPARPSVPRSTQAPRTPIDEFETMSPEERQKALNRLPPGQREKLQERLQKFNELPPEQQESLKNLYSRLHQLPLEQQEAVHQAVGRFSQESPGRQQAMREELQNLGNLSEQERRGRMRSSEFRKKFSRKEQGIVRDMAPLLAAQ